MSDSTLLYIQGPDGQGGLINEYGVPILGSACFVIGFAGGRTLDGHDLFPYYSVFLEEHRSDGACRVLCVSVPKYKLGYALTELGFVAFTLDNFSLYGLNLPPPGEACIVYEVKPFSAYGHTPVDLGPPALKLPANTDWDRYLRFCLNQIQRDLFAQIRIRRIASKPIKAFKTSVKIKQGQIKARAKRIAEDMQRVATAPSDIGAKEILFSKKPSLIDEGAQQTKLKERIGNAFDIALSFFDQADLFLLEICRMCAHKEFGKIFLDDIQTSINNMDFAQCLACLQNAEKIEHIEYGYAVLHAIIIRFCDLLSADISDQLTLIDAEQIHWLRCIILNKYQYNLTSDHGELIAKLESLYAELTKKAARIAEQKVSAEQATDVTPTQSTTVTISQTQSTSHTVSSKKKSFTSKSKSRGRPLEEDIDQVLAELGVLPSTTPTILTLSEAALNTFAALVDLITTADGRARKIYNFLEKEAKTANVKKLATETDPNTNQTLLMLALINDDGNKMFEKLITWLINNSGEAICYKDEFGDSVLHYWVERCNSKLIREAGIEPQKKYFEQIWKLYNGA